MFTEDDLLPLSALQHLLFCERQCALIHLEQIWVENPLTVEGRHLHERVDAGRGESGARLHVARGLSLRNFRLGLSGKADLVEFHRLAEGEAGAVLAGFAGTWRPFPVEYKRGKPKAHRADEVQLCAQALCLEEMLGADVPAGALFYGQIRRRREVPFDASLRDLTEATAARLHRLIGSGATPPPVYESKCDKCSLLTVCMPAAPSHSARRYLERAVRDAAQIPSPSDEVGVRS
ncbi:MAG TPA: CRISPR-associated protein Cas4 [Thermoanaerobaculia bacterium]|jgi:CRISPR-associated exonuclease Cas4|nr:CRISPR-associated protein Cas4 [Thermoanaerobaculia bacterium]